MADESFGQLLRAARKRAGFHTIAAFADALEIVGLNYSDDAISSWETDRRKPYRSDGDRDTALKIFQLLADRGGIEDTTQIDAMLRALDRPLLSAEEKDQLFSGLGIPIENLPEKPPYDRLVGRDDALTAIGEVLQSPSGKQVIVVSGLGGIGKTAVAYESIKRVMASGQYEKLAWETAKSEEFTGISIRLRRLQSIGLSTVLASYARQLGFDSLANQPPHVLHMRLQNILRQGNYLLVLDNLETLEAAQDAARELYELISPGRSRVLITSRERLADEPFVVDYFVKGLSEPASLELLRDEAESRGAAALLQADITLLKSIHTTTGGMPLCMCGRTDGGTNYPPAAHRNTPSSKADPGRISIQRDFERFRLQRVRRKLP